MIVRCGMATGVLLVASFVSGQPPAPAPPLEDFVAATNPDDRIALPAMARLAAVWRDDYAAMLVDLTRFFRGTRRGGDEINGYDIAGAGGGNAEEDLPSGGGPPRGGGAGGGFAPVRPPDPSARIRVRLTRFLEKQTNQRFGDDLKKWRRWYWNRPYNPHPDYAAFKARLYANVDPRMAGFFPSNVKASIRLDEIDWGGVGVNGIPPLDHPKVAKADAPEAAFVGDKNIVYGLVINGEARAYPKRILAWHEMALDRVGGVELAVVFCTLCGTVIPYETEAAGRTFTLGTSGLLYRSNKLMFDAETKSLWSTLEGRPVVGPLVGSGLQLKFRPVVTTTWKEWKEAHPETTVLTLDTGHKRDYGEGVAYNAYFGTDQLMFEVPGADPRLKNKDEVLSLLLSEESDLSKPPSPVALAASFLKKNPVYEFETAGVRYLVLTTPGGANRVYRLNADSFRTVGAQIRGGEIVDGAGLTWRIDEDSLVSGAKTLDRVPARRTFWFAWASQFPKTALFR